MTAPGPHRVTTLDRGLRVVTEAMPSVRSTAMAFWIDSGSVSEGAEEAGLSHLLEHMLFRGTDRFGSQEIDQIFDGMGAELNAGTGKDSTSIYTRVLDRHLKRAMDVVSDMVWRPTMGELEAEREVVLEEIAMYEDDPQDRVFDLLGEAVFGSHPLGRPVIGRAEVVGGADRGRLERFHATRYVPAGVVVAAAGSVDHDELVAIVESSAPAPARTSSPGRAASSDPAPTSRPPELRFLAKETEQYHVCLGARGLARDDERRFALRVLDNILGGTSSSRLFVEVRERRGLAYSVFSFQSLYATAGEIGIYMGTRPENLEEAMAVIGEELRRFVADPATEAELERSRENVKGRTMLALESTSTRMNRLGSSLLAKMPILTLDEILERIDAVTMEEVRALAAELLNPSALSAAGIGPDATAMGRALAAVSERLAECAGSLEAA